MPIFVSLRSILTSASRLCPMALVCVSLLCAGCSLSRQTMPWRKPGLQWSEAVRDLERANPGQVERSPEKPLTLSAEAMSLAEFVRYLTRVSPGASIVVAESLDSRQVSIEVNNLPLDQLLAMVARRLGVELTRVGETFYLGDLRAEDLGVLVRRVRRLSPEQAVSAVKVFASSVGSVQVSQDGLAVVGDRVEVLSRVNEMLDRLDAAAGVSWAVQARIVALSDEDVVDLGIDVTPAVRASALLAAASSGVSATGSAKAGVDAVLRAVRSGSRSRMVAEPVLIVEDGATSTVKVGRVVPVAKRTVSDQGTATVAGYEKIDVGLSLTVGLREITERAGRLSVTVDDSSFVSLLDGAPVVDQQSLQVSAHVVDGGTYLVGGYRRTRIKSSLPGPLSWGARREGAGENLLVFVSVARIETKPPPASDAVAEPGAVVPDVPAETRENSQEAVGSSDKS